MTSPAPTPPPADPIPALVKGLILDAQAWDLVQLAVSHAADHYQQRFADLTRLAAADAVHFAPHLTAVMEHTTGAADAARELADELRKLHGLIGEKRARLAREHRRQAVPFSPHAEAQAERIDASLPAELPLVDLGQGSSRVQTYVCPQCHLRRVSDPVSLCGECAVQLDVKA